jgi:hypothetical protein
VTVNRVMNTKKRNFLSSVVGVVLTTASIFFLYSPGAIAIPLTGATMFSTDIAGNFSGGNLWNTVGGDGAYNLYIVDGGPAGPFLNSGNGTATTPNINLSVGTHTFSVFGEPGNRQDFFGLNLFFDGSNNAGISVFAPLRTTGVVPVFSANAGTATGGNLPYVNLVPGAGTLTFASSGMTVTLTEFFWAYPGVAGVSDLDRNSGFDNLPNGSTDFVGAFSLNVTAVPEPETYALMLAGLGLLGFVARRRKQKAA